MSEQQAPGHQDTPAVAGPDQAPGTAPETPPYGDPNDPYQKRYDDLRPWADKVAKEVSELRPYKDRATELEQREQWWNALLTGDEDTQRQAAEILGIELQEPDNGSEFEEFTDTDDPVEQLRAELNELREWRDSLSQQEQQAAEVDFVTGWAHDQLDELGVTDPETKQWIFERALSMPHLRPQPGMPTNWLPDVKAAHEQYRAWADNQMKTWAKTKQAPYVPSGGLPANEVPDPGTGHQARMNRAMLSLRNSMGDNE